MRFDPVAIAHETQDEQAFEREVLAHLEREVGFEAAFFAFKGAPATTVNVDARRLDQAIQRVDYAQEIAPLKLAALSSKQVVVDTDLLGEKKVRTLGYHRDFAAPIGGRHTLLGFLSVRGAPIGGLMLGRTGRTFSASEIARIEELLPHLAVARASYRLPSWQEEPLRTEPDPWRWLRGGRAVQERVDGTPELLVRDRGAEREMVAMDGQGELVWTRVSRAEPSRSGWFYIDLLHLAAVRASAQRRFLFIGSGGGVVVRQFARVYPGAQLDVVERDERVVGLARRWFDLDRVPNLRVAVADGAAFLAHAEPDTWDAIIVDAFEGSSFASSFGSRPFFASARRALRQGGGLAMNLIAALSDSSLVRIERAAAAEHLEPRLVPVLDPGERYAADDLRNVVLIGERR